MDGFSGDISDLVFKGSVKGDIGEFSLDSHMLKVLMQLDGRKNIAVVASASGLNQGEIKAVLARLAKLGLIEKVDHSPPTLNQAFFDHLESQLSIAMGPHCRSAD